MRTQNPEIAALAERAGIVFDGALDFLPRTEAGSLDAAGLQLAFDGMAMDAPTYNQPSLITTANGAIPAFLTTFIDPKLIKVLLAPLKAEEIYGSVKKGDWTTSTAMFIMTEPTGEVSGYGDFTENGRSSANFQYPQRQNYVFQTMTEWGERELEMVGLGKIDWAAQLNMSSANTLNRFANLMGFYGISGLQNYGGLNDPSLSASLTPNAKAAGGLSWSAALPTEILADIQKAFNQLQVQTGGNLELTDDLTLALHPTSEVYLANTNSFGLTAMEMIRKVFPKLTVKNAVQYLSGTTYSFQLIAPEIEGQRTCETAFSEKMRAHRIVPAASSFKQKKTAGGWGTIIYRPVGITSMAGV